MAAASNSKVDRKKVLSLFHMNDPFQRWQNHFYRWTLRVQNTIQPNDSYNYLAKRFLVGNQTPRSWYEHSGYPPLYTWGEDLSAWHESLIKFNESLIQFIDYIDSGTDNAIDEDKKESIWNEVKNTRSIENACWENISVYTYRPHHAEYGHYPWINEIPNTAVMAFKAMEYVSEIKATNKETWQTQLRREIKKRPDDDPLILSMGNILNNLSTTREDILPKKKDMLKAFGLVDVKKVKVVLLFNKPSKKEPQCGGWACHPVSQFGDYRSSENLFSANYVLLKALQYDYNVHGTPQDFFDKLYQDYERFSVHKQFKEVERAPKKLKEFFDKYGTPINPQADPDENNPDGGILHWGQEGVLVLNTKLTTGSGKMKLDNDWINFTREILKIVHRNNPNCVYATFGYVAKTVGKVFHRRPEDSEENRNLRFLEPLNIAQGKLRGNWIHSCHPSQFIMTITKGYDKASTIAKKAETVEKAFKSLLEFIKNQPFTQINFLLKNNGTAPVKWIDGKHWNCWTNNS